MLYIYCYFRFRFRSPLEEFANESAENGGGNKGYLENAGNLTLQILQG